MAVRRGASARLDVAVVVVLCAFGAGIRLPALTSRDVWFDDAWAALPAHVPLSDAVRMVVTTPIYTLGLRSWIQLGPAHTWWAQLPALVLGVVGIAAVYGLVRAHGYARSGAFIAGAVIAAGPITVAYSGRVKEYSADLVLACVVLWLVERWRSSPSTRGIVALGVASIAAMWISASTAAVVGGAAACVLAVAWSRPELRRHAMALVGSLAVGAAALWLVFLRRLPHQLRVNWRTHGFLFGYSSVHHVAFAFQQTFSGLAHGLFGLPIPYTFEVGVLRAAPMALSALAVLVVAALVVPPLVRVARTRGATTSPSVAAAVAILLGIVGTLTGISPLGDGRTDEALYPALLVLMVGAATGLSRRARAGTPTTTAARWAIVGAVVVGAAWFGTTHLAEYPPTGLRTVFTTLERQLRPGDLVVVDGYESFTWAQDGLGRWAVSFRQGAVPWPMGFHVQGLERSVVISSKYLQPDASILSIAARTHRVWFVGPTVGGYSTSAPRPLWSLPFATPTFSFFAGTHFPFAGANGWRPTVRGCCTSSGTFAWLFVHR